MFADIKNQSDKQYEQTFLKDKNRIFRIVSRDALPGSFYRDSADAV